MVDPTLAEQAAEMLRTTALDMEEIYADAERSEFNLKACEAELEKEYHTNGIPVSLCKAYARADEKWAKQAEFRAQAYGALRGLESRRDAAKILIGLYQSQVKDRM